MSEVLWLIVGIVIGSLVGVVSMALVSVSRVRDMEAEILHERFKSKALKEEIFRLENSPKPKPRK